MIQQVLHKSYKQSGFTLIELLLVIVLIAGGFGLIALNSGRAVNTTSLTKIADILVADIKSQQLKAMLSDGGSDNTPEPFGIFIQSNQYTLFKNASYVAGNADNFVISIPSPVSLSTTFASSQLVFSRNSGDVSGFSAVANTITITDTAANSTVTLTINRYGAITRT